MNSSARVTSIDALRHLKIATEVFDSDARNAIAAITLEIRRLLEWIEHDRTRYWPRELRKAFDRVTEARNDLERCLMRSGDENARSCYDEKKALERAKRRVRTCEEKIQQVKYWRRQLRHDAEEFTGQLTRLETHLDIDWGRATAALQRMITALDKYSEQRQPQPAEVARPVSPASPQLAGDPQAADPNAADPRASGGGASEQGTSRSSHVDSNSDGPSVNAAGESGAPGKSDASGGGSDSGGSDSGGSDSGGRQR